MTPWNVAEWALALALSTLALCASVAMVVATVSVIFGGRKR